MDINAAFKPFLDIFTRSQVQSILLAWIPTKLAPFLTGIIAVDMFISTVIASGITAISYLIYQFMCNVIFENTIQRKSISVQIEYYALGQYNERKKNIIYESLSWIISQQSKELKTGSFILKVVPNMDNKDIKTLPTSNIIPEIDKEIFIEYNRNIFKIKYKFPENKNNNNNLNNINNEIISIIAHEKPSIYISTINNSNTKVEKIYQLLNDLTNSYLEFQKSESGRFRYENTRSHWVQIQKLSSCRGLESIALDEKQEKILKKELQTFVNDRKFYENLGLPYRRGILLYGKPGTGKTSLINAISSHLSRNIYYFNLKNVESDSELSALFSSVPPNQLIIIEDADAQTKILHERYNKSNNNLLIDKNPIDKLFEDRKEYKKPYFSLSNFLSCLDGHILSEGNIIIMTTNHVEILDPACIRPGRMDLHLELGYCTQYQIRKLFKSIISHTELNDETLKMIPERLLPPCEVMTTLTLYREDNSDMIIRRIFDLVNKYAINSKIEINSSKCENFKKRIYYEENPNDSNFKKIKIC